MNHTRFSIIVPTYNRAILILPSLNSLQEMEYDNFEVIVVDDGSKDNTGEAVKALGDDRIKYYWKENGERGAARNYGITKATGDYVGFLDSDDLVYPNHLKEAARQVEEHHRPEMFYCAHEWINPEGKLLKKSDYIKGDVNKLLLGGNIFSINGVFIRRDIALQHPFNETRKLSATEDWLLWLQLAARYPIYYTNIITSAIVNHDERSTLNYDEQAMMLRTKLLMENLEADPVFMGKYGKYLPVILAHMYSYIAIHLAISHKKGRAIKFLLKAVEINFSELFTRRTLAIIKHTMLPA